MRMVWCCKGFAYCLQLVGGMVNAKEKTLYTHSSFRDRVYHGAEAQAKQGSMCVVSHVVDVRMWTQMPA